MHSRFDWLCALCFVHSQINNYPMMSYRVNPNAFVKDTFILIEMHAVKPVIEYELAGIVNEATVI